MDKIKNINQDILEYTESVYDDETSYGISEGSHDVRIISMEIIFPANISESREVFPKLGKCDITIRGDEGNYVPHFHIEGAGGQHFSCCVKLFAPEFFVHGKHRDILTEKNDIKFLNKFMKQPSGEGDMTNWERLVHYWILTYPNSIYPTGHLKQPDYSKLKG